MLAIKRQQDVRPREEIDPPFGPKRKGAANCRLRAESKGCASLQAAQSAGWRETFIKAALTN